MTGHDTTARLAALIEEELGNFRAFADLPATEIETMARRLARAVEPALAPAAAPDARRSAA